MFVGEICLFCAVSFTKEVQSVMRHMVTCVSHSTSFISTDQSSQSCHTNLAKIPSL